MLLVAKEGKIIYNKNVLLMSISGGNMKHKICASRVKDLIALSAQDILNSIGMQSEKQYLHHGSVNCYEHSLRVAYLAGTIALKLRLPVNMRSLLRGALLHDYYLYDWHEPDKSHKLHGFIHARRALKNADRDFELSEIEKDIISKHMFPLNLKPPKYIESVTVCVADKICTTSEFITSTISLIYPRMNKYGIL